MTGMARHWRERIAWALAGLLALGVVAAYTGVIEGGPLDPPAGPPASTDSVRLPGTPISSLPFSASAAGHYYFTRDLTNAGAGAAITVNGDDVSIDLNGFTMRGTGFAAFNIGATRTRVSIRNGGIVGFTTGINQPANAALTQITIEDLTIRAAGAPIAVQERATIRRVSAIDATAAGIVAGADATIESVLVENTVGFGIDAGADSAIRACTVSGNNGGAAGQAAIRVGAGSIIEHCVVRGNQSAGIVGGDGTRVSDVIANGNTAGDAMGVRLGQGSSVLNTVARTNAGAGIVVGNYSIVERCTANLNGASGIVIGARSTVRASVVDANNVMGIEATNAAGAVIESNSISRNDSHGIEAGTGVRILNNTIRGNGAATAGTADGSGISLISTISIVEGNLLTNNDVGLTSTSGNNSIYKNTAYNNLGGDYAFAADDLEGTTITAANDTTDTHSHYNYEP